MGIKAASSKIVDLRKAPKDIVEGARKGADLGKKMANLGKVGRKLTDLLRSKIPLK